MFWVSWGATVTAVDRSHKVYPMILESVRKQSISGSLDQIIMETAFLESVFVMRGVVSSFQRALEQYQKSGGKSVGEWLQQSCIVP